MKKRLPAYMICLSILLCSCSAGETTDDITSSDSLTDSPSSDNSIDLSSTDVSEAEKPASDNIKTTEELLANPLNEVRNGLIIIRDPNDYPTYIDDLRFLSSVERTNSKKFKTYKNIYGEDIFTLQTYYNLIFQEGLAYFSQTEDGLSGYVDINGNIVIEPQYNSADFFINGSACAENIDGEEIYIDKEGNPSVNKMYEGYNGEFKKGYYYGTFTGKYVTYMFREGKYQRRYGYADAEGNHYDMPSNVLSLCPFQNGYAIVCAYVEDPYVQSLYIIDEDFNVVSHLVDKIDNDTHLFIDRISNYDSDQFKYTECILPGGYFIAGPDSKKFVVKICPELYVEQS